jgi:predicted phage terminase large subunit-like protein
LVVKDESGHRLFLESVHLEWLKFIQKCEANGKDRIGIIAPWGHGKSASIIIGKILYELPKNVNRRIKVIANSEEFSQARVVTLQRYIESDEDYKTEFGDVIKPAYRETWGQSKFVIERQGKSIDGTLEAHGIMTTGISGRADELYFDDIQDYNNTVASKANRKKVKEHFYNVWLTRLSPNGRVYFIATPWHKDDLLHDLLQNSEWAFLIQRINADLSCIEQIEVCPDKNTPKRINRMFEKYPIKEIPLWSKWNKERIEKARNDLKLHAFNRGFRMHPYVEDAGKMFNRLMFKEVLEYAPQSHVRIRCWDLAGTEAEEGKDPDYTAGTRISVYGRDKLCIEDQVAFRMGTYDSEDIIRQTAQLDGRDTIVVIEREPGSSGKYTIDHFRRVVLPGFAVYEIVPTKSKTVRALQFQSHAQAGNISIVNGSWLEDFFEELEMFPEGEHDDRVDSVSAGIEFIASRFLGTEEIGESRASIL